MEQNVVLEMRDISKNFTGVRALSHVDFTLRKGEIHAFLIHYIIYRDGSSKMVQLHNLHHAF